jgi:hypothetical protein
VGPGAYNLPPLFGSKPVETRTRNMPYISFGQKTKPVYEKGLVKELMLSQSPAIKYSPNYEASSLKQSPSKAVIGKGPKFLKTRQRFMHKVPIQYSTDSSASFSNKERELTPE